MRQGLGLHIIIIGIIGQGLVSTDTTGRMYPSAIIGRALIEGTVGRT
jgi:hypothetical protein